MDITPIVPAGRQLIQGYGDGMFRVSGTVHRGSILIFPARTLAWPVTRPAEITLDTLAAVSASEVELLLIGTGPRIEPLAAELKRAMRTSRIALEAMDTGAACRTYNVLMSEERRVAAALIAL
ncbi:MAG TPA: Mth938-like domain-containing protein [Alphaproteobacteria bacterium]|nr:Mth938-like domain-containing protein [Alphaproteobacteria bacterium]